MSKRNQRDSEPSAAEQIPLYVRWTPERSQYALEMRLDLVARITLDLLVAEKQGIEIGGMLLGSLPDSTSQILRVDDVSMIGRRFEDGAIYVLDPGQHHRFAEITEAAKELDTVPVGFFRSHVRPGPLQPSIADKTLLSSQFPHGDYALLLIQSSEPRTAAFFLASSGQLPDHSSVRKFSFDEEEFKYLPEIPSEESEFEEDDEAVEPAVGRNYRWVAISVSMLLVGLAAFAAFSGVISRWFRPPANKLGLSAASAAGVLKITWDHNAPFVLNAKGAVLMIDDGPRRREVDLHPDELKLGEVDYERRGKKVSIIFMLDSPGSNLPPQTLDWSGN